MTHDTPIITRVAPSPTGLLHIGTARTALFNYLFARQYHGTFALRIEDTDKARSTRENEQDILDGLAWLGLTHDTFVRQSERVTLHTEAIDALLAAGAAYVSQEPAKDDPEHMVEVVRLRNQGEVIAWDDAVRGTISFDTTELGDFVIARSRTDPLYHLAVVVDDADMGVTHVIRGEDHISNTPRQILIQKALGYPLPTYAHLPLILAPDRSKMSKRKGAVSLSSYREEGYLPEALLNYLALLGWNPGTDEEQFSLDELVTVFSLEGVQKGGAVFDIEKLKWHNREHRKRRSAADDRAYLLGGISDSAYCEALAGKDAAIDDLRDRYATYSELNEAIAAGEYVFYVARPVLDPDKIIWRKDPRPEQTAERTRHVCEILETIDDAVFSREVVEQTLTGYAEAEGKGNVLWPVRYALSGRERSPDPFTLLATLGKQESLARLRMAAEHCAV